jgi:hypothetical protein
MTTTEKHAQTPFDAEAVARADEASARALDDLLGAGARPRGVVVTAPAGAGKSHLIASAVCRARSSGLRVAVAAPTNDQAFGLVGAIARRHGMVESVTFVPASDVTLPPDVASLPGVQELSAKEASGEPLIVGTLSKLGDAFARGSLGTRDLLLMDEAFQADAAKYFAVAGLAGLHLLVGDGGQISPFSTIDDPTRWRGLPEDPLQTSVGVLLRNRPQTPVHRLPITRRLDGRAARVARLFYPDLPFDPAVLPGVRELTLRRAAAATPLDAALDVAACRGWAHLELPQAAVLQADPEAVEVIAGLVRRLFDRKPRARCERHPEPAELRPEQVAVGVSHNDQKDLLRVALAARGLGGVVVQTANKLQGLEFEVVVAWHPLSGLCEADGFHLDPGRLCVLLTRHRQACVVVGRAGDDELLDGHPPATPAFLGWDPDPVLDGWGVHRAVFQHLGGFRIAA